MDIKLNEGVETKYLITPNDRGVAVDKLYELGVNAPSDKLCRILNSINNQGITDVSVEFRTYTKDGKVLSFDRLATSEVLFLLTALADMTKMHIEVYRYDTQLSTKVLKKYLSMFGKSDSVTLLLDTETSMTYHYWRELCLR